jgi:hypothetical protein
MSDLDAHNPFGPRGVKKPAHFPTSNAQDGANLVLGFVLFVIQLGGAHSEQLVIELVDVASHEPSLIANQQMLSMVLI